MVIYCIFSRMSYVYNGTFFATVAHLQSSHYFLFPACFVFHLPMLYFSVFRTAVGVNSYFYEELDDFKPPLIVALPPVTSPMTPVTTSQHSSIKCKPQNTTSMNALDKPPNYDALYAACDVVTSCVPNIPSLQGVSGNNVYAVPNSDILVNSVDCALVEFPRKNLRFVQVLGEGEFGEVCSCPWYIVWYMSSGNAQRHSFLTPMCQTSNCANISCTKYQILYSRIHRIESWCLQISIILLSKND